MPEFRIRGFKYGRGLLGETTHKTESSAGIEIAAWQNRMLRGEVDYVEIIDMRPGGRLTNLRVHANTRIEWSWSPK